MLNFQRIVLGLWIGVALSGEFGCSPTAYQPVTGVVMLDGKPLHEATVVFAPAESGESATSITDRDGQFELATHQSKGAAPGKYVVLVTKLDQNVSKAVALNSHLVPKIYSNKATSPLKITLPTTEEIQFDLTSKK